MAPYVQGDIILRSRPFSAILDEILPKTIDRPSNFTCQQCLWPRCTFQALTPPVKPTKRCSSCLQVSYCSRECQALHWKSIHKHECALLKRFFANKGMMPEKEKTVFTRRVRPIAQCILRLASAEKKQGRGDGEEDEEMRQARLFLQLDSLSNEIKEARDSQRWQEWYRDYPKRRKQLARYLQGNAYFQSLSEKQVLDIACRQAYHSKMLTERNDEVDLLSVEIAGIAHSCDANASAVLRDDGFVHLIANRSIECDDDIRISYEDDLLPTNLRRLRLRANYFIDCQCQLCTDSSASPTRDDYLRSIRCYASMGSGSETCDAPCPLTEQCRPAISTCANGHSQQYSHSQLEAYRRNLHLLEYLQFRAHTIRLTSKSDVDWIMFEHYWHPINTHTFGNLLVSEYRHAVDTVQLTNAMVQCRGNSGLDKFFVGEGARHLVERYDRWVSPRDHYNLYGRLLWSLVQLPPIMKMYHNTVRPPSGKNQAAARTNLDLFKQLQALAERFLGQDSARASAIRMVGRMSPAQWRAFTVNGSVDASAIGRRTRVVIKELFHFQTATAMPQPGCEPPDHIARYTVQLNDGPIRGTTPGSGPTSNYWVC